MVSALASLVLFASCKKKDDDITPTERAKFDVELIMAEGDASKDAPVNVTPTKGTVKAKIAFTSTLKEMERVYITQNIAGAGETVYEVTEDVSLKGDKSIDVSNANKHSLEYIINLPVPAGISVGTVVYTVWATKGNGDHRKKDKRTIVGIGTITLVYGGANPAAQVKSYSATLYAPAADGSSNTFLSLLDGNTYKINEGQEKAAYWDFGYFYSAASTGDKKASFASTATYETAFKNATTNVAIVEIAPTDLNNCYFQYSTSVDFTTVTTSADLDAVVISNTSFEEITDVTVGEIIGFMDNYGKKGLIKVIEVSGTYNPTDFIKIEIKVQP